RSRRDPAVARARAVTTRVGTDILRGSSRCAGCYAAGSMKRSLLVVLLLALPLAVGAFFQFASGGRGPRDVRARPGEGAKAPATEPAPVIELVPAPVVRMPSGEVPTTVLWPVKVELELLEARFLPKEEGVPPIGSGAGARFSGRIAGFNDEGV